MVLKNNSYIVVIGCGKLGSYLANKLSNEGHSVVVIDIDAHSFEALAPDKFSGFRIEGDATELATLKQAKIDKADVVIGATHDENINVMAAQIAKNTFNVPKALIRIVDPQKEAFCRITGLRSICPTTIAAEKMMMLLNEV